MRTMVFSSSGAYLQMKGRASPKPRAGEVRAKMSACSAGPTNLHVVDAELRGITYPIICGHEIVGCIGLVGSNATTDQVNDRVGFPSLEYTCSVCRFCKDDMENLCHRALSPATCRMATSPRTPLPTPAMLSWLE